MELSVQIRLNEVLDKAIFKYSATKDKLEKIYA